MERVTFLVEKTGQRIVCQLNPEKVVVRRAAGVVRRGSTSGPISGPDLQENPLLYTGGGSTEIELELLFDASLRLTAAAIRETEEEVSADVRELTRPLMRLSEGSDVTEGEGPPLVRFIWGKHWNVLGVVSAIAERLEYFTPGGAPQRSWLRMRLLRVPETTEPTELSPGLDDLGSEELQPEAEIPPEQVTEHEVLGGGAADEEVVTQRPDEIAWLNFLDPAKWRSILRFNNIDDPFSLTPGQKLRIPPRPGAGS